MRLPSLCMSNCTGLNCAYGGRDPVLEPARHCRGGKALGDTGKQMSGANDVPRKGLQVSG